MLNLFQHLINRVPNQVQDDKYDILFCANYMIDLKAKIAGCTSINRNHNQYIPL